MEQRNVEIVIGRLADEQFRRRLGREPQASPDGLIAEGMMRNRVERRDLASRRGARAARPVPGPPAPEGGPSSSARGAGRRVGEGLVMRRAAAWLAGPLLAASLSRPVCGQPAAAGGPPLLTLEAAVAAALQSNRLVANASLEVEKAADETAMVRSQRLPNLTLGALGTQLLAPFTFTLEQGLLGTYPGIGPVPAQDT
ncbi:MAG: hypothetical protein ACRD3M_04705, partial [Thermoanaerobaculia bacterium]